MHFAKGAISWKQLQFKKKKRQQYQSLERKKLAVTKSLIIHSLAGLGKAGTFGVVSEVECRLAPGTSAS
jgi:protein tyrosine phosphatase